MTPSKTPFAGLQVLAPGDSLATDGYAILSQNPVITDKLGKLGAVTHRHDAHSAMADPTSAATVVTAASGGVIPASTSIHVVYTLTDSAGGETLGTTPIIVTTSAGYLTPTTSPTLVVSYSAGTLLASTPIYAVTVTDGVGGETALSPARSVTINPGHANAEVLVSGLTAIANTASSSDPAAGWRLWRSVDGGTIWHLMGADAAATDTFTDDGSFGGDTTVRPPATGTTIGTNQLTVTVPSSGQPAGATFFTIYASRTSSFITPCALGTYPVSDYDVDKVYTALTLTPGQPPAVSSCFPGADQIDPDTDILAWTWKLTVANEAALPSMGNTDGDARIALDTHLEWVWNGSAWKRGPWFPPVAAFANLPATGLLDGDLCMALDTHIIWTYDLGNSAWRTLGLPRETKVTSVTGLVAATETAKTLNMISPAVNLYAVTVDAASRIRLYPTAAMATSDVARVASSDPDVAFQGGAVYEHTFSGAATHSLTPAALVVMQETSIASTIAANVSRAAGGTVNITLAAFRVQ